MLDKNILKQWFKSRAKPTQSQFWQWIDACFFKGEKLEKTDVNGLDDSLSDLQLQINNNLPNQLISGGNISIDTDDGTTLSVYLPETKYKLKGASYTQSPGTFNLSLRPETGLFRIDVFYLDSTGFHVATGAVSATPVKPGVSDDSLELSNILIGFDNVLDVSSVPDTPDLSAVLAAGNEATDDIVLSDKIFIAKNTVLDRLVKVTAEGLYYDDNVVGKHMHLIMPNPLTDDQDLVLPDTSGTLAITDDLVTKEDISNKATDLSNPNDVKYPTTLAVDTALKQALDQLNNNIPADVGNDLFNYYNF